MNENNIDRALGNLEGKIDQILHAQVRADRQLDVLSKAPDKIDRLEERIARIEPMAAEFNRWRERGIGALMLLTFVSALLGAAITAAWQKILKFLGGAFS